jgi:NAD-dependent SIR2 family protein deacetylase
MYAVESGAKLVIINLSPTPMDSKATAHIDSKAGEAMSNIVERVKSQLSTRSKIL